MKGKIDYINPEPPGFDIPEYPGDYYDSWIPATLDIAQRAELCINALTETTDPEYDDELYWIVDLLAQEPTMYHSVDDHVQAKFLLGLPLNRMISGSRQNIDVENRLLRTYLKMQGPDGLIYIPIKGRPWALPGEKETFAGLDFLPQGDHWCSIAMNGRVLGAFCVYALKDSSGPWRNAALRLARGLMGLCIVEEDIAYLFKGCTEPGLPVTRPPERPSGTRAALGGWVAHGLAKCSRFLGYEDAGEMSAKLMRYIMRDSGYFLEGGKFGRDSDDLDLAHFHAHTTQIMSALEAFEATGDHELLELAKAAYQYAISKGEPLLGFFPEWIGGRGGTTSEICGVADMIVCGLKMSRMGMDEWENVDRWIRNQFAECQLTGTGWLTDGHLKKVDREKVKLPRAGGGPPEHGTTDRVLERVVGSFAGWPSPCDFVKGNGWSIMHCCTGNASRALYYIWDGILTWKEGKLKVNLLLNRASPWADVKSHIPYVGRVEVEAKREMELEIRLPEWADTEEAKCTVNGSPRLLRYNDRYALIGSVKGGDQVCLEFPIHERTGKLTIAGRAYTVIRRGNEVVWIDPPGENCPLYQRGHYRGGRTLWKRVKRFICDQQITWF